MKSAGIYLLTLLVFVLLFSIANSLTIGNWKEFVLIEDRPVESSFVLGNEKDSSETVSIEALLPLEAIVLEGESITIPANSEKTITIKFFPKPEVVNQTYSGKIVFSAFEEKIEKEIILNIFAPSSCAVELELKKNYFDSKKKEFVLSFNGTNNSTGNRIIFLKKINGIPEDWKFEQKQISFKALEEKEFSVKINPQSSFVGRGKLVFDCPGKEKAIEANFSFKNGKAAAAGFAGLGFAQKYSLEIVLFAIAVILALGFCARYLKRMNEVKQK